MNEEERARRNHQVTETLLMAILCVLVIGGLTIIGLVNGP